MDWYILKHINKNGQIIPEDLLVLNEEGAVVVDEDYGGRTNPGAIMKMNFVKQ